MNAKAFAAAQIGIGGLRAAFGFDSALGTGKIKRQADRVQMESPERVKMLVKQ
ncbi:MAG: hypothetical protein ING09_12850 [Roseomonas sp.]|nr:hypothetical protein [Roseomonas sp.]MCA3291915.1 hypothetical protein [Roseomonas sp.]MCA3295277.1 hypothetical protein [Roseomonas sp.]